MPSIQKIHKKYESRGVVVLGMHTDSKTDKDAPKIMKNLGCDYTLLTGAGSVSASYQVSGIPALYIIGTDGKVAWTHVGNSPKLEADMSAALDALLAGAK